MKIACLLIPHFAALVAQSRRDPARDADAADCAAREGHADLSPSGLLILTEAPGDPGRVLDCSPEAAALGVTPGMALRQAERLCPQAIVRPAALERYLSAWEQVLGILESFTPDVEPEELGCAYLDLAGLERHYAGDHELCQGVLKALLERTNLAAQMGVAGGKFPAWMAASIVGPGRALLIPAGAERGFLSAVPAERLPLDAESLRRLSLLGIRTIGQFAALPARAVAAQFGQPGRWAHRLARGQDPRPVAPRRPRPQITGQRSFDPPLDDGIALGNVARDLARELLDGLQAQGLACQSFGLSLEFEDGQVWESQRVLDEPTTSVERLGVNLDQLLRGLEWPGRVEGLGLTLAGLVPQPGRQLDLIVHPAGEEDERLGGILHHLIARYGPQRFCRADLVDPGARLPERRFVLVECESS